MKTFVVNCGSSSIKYKLYSMTNETVLASGVVERVGSDEAVITHKTAETTIKGERIQGHDHTEALTHVLKKLVEPGVGVLESISEILGVGHRVVHAGEHYCDSVIIDDSVKNVIKELFGLSPLHNPANLMGIEAATKAMPDTPQIAVFDTAFLATMPKKAWMYPVPMEWYTEHGVRRYGFHGTSHKFVTNKTAQIFNKPVNEINLITCHLGNGGSITAVQNGKAIDHSMGMTPLAGIPMGTRSGDIDPAIIFYMAEQIGMSIEEIDNALNKKAGLLGVSGCSNDMRDLLEAREKGNERADIAVEMFWYRVAKYIGAYSAIMPELDAIVFTGGIGENCWDTRSEVCKQLSSLGIAIDEEANHMKGKQMAVSTPESKIPVWVVPTDEELMIARDTEELVAAQTAK